MHVQVIQLWAKIDNLDVDRQTGDIWTAAHPAAYKALQYMNDPMNTISPSQVIYLLSSRP